MFQEEENATTKKISTIGGTFDTLHQGHKEYIKLALDFCHHTIIYLKTDEYVNGKKNYQVRPYKERYEKLAEFVAQIGCSDKCEIRPHDKADDLIVAYLKEFDSHDILYMAFISPEYYEKFLEINQLREAEGLSSILLVVKPRLCHGKQDISSSSIRGAISMPNI